MSSVETLIAAFADEDRRLRELADTYPPAFRDVPPQSGKLSLKQTLGHLAFWDRFTVKFFKSRLHDADVDAPSLGEIEDRNREELARIYDMPYEQVLELYVGATSDIQTFLRDHWTDLDETERGNFNIPLKHRRHHRRLLVKALAIFAPELTVTEEAQEKAG
jgi:hypothetical protein